MSSRFRHALRWLIAVALYHSGAWRIATRKKRAGARFLVLRYHRLRDDALADEFHLSVSPRTFAAQLRFLARHYRVTDLEGCTEHLQRPGQRTPVLLTFDDGYRDNHAMALPLLRGAAAPALLFVTHDLMGTRRRFWWDELAELVAGATRQTVELGWSELHGGHGQATLSLDTPTGKRQAVELLEQIGNRVSDQEQQRLIAAVASAVGRPAGERAPMTLSWDEVRELAAAGVEIGAHGLSHCLLTKVPEGRARSEIVDSRQRIAEQLGRPVRAFAYPGGQLAPWMLATAREAGYSHAFTTEPGENRQGFDPHAIVRRAVHEAISVDPWGRFSAAMFALHVEGFLERR